MKSDVFSLDLPLKKPFHVSSGYAEKKKNYFVSIDKKYFGEAAGSVQYGPDDDNIHDDLVAGCRRLESIEWPTVADLRELSQSSLNDVSKSALIGAVLHCISGQSGRFPWQIVDLEPPGRIRTSFTVSIDDPLKMADAIRQSGYPIIKIKMGFDNDESLIPLLRDIPGRLFRVDANGGWDLEKAERMIFQLNRLEVDIIEQPTAVEYIREWPYLRGRSRILLFVDEGLDHLDDYYRFGDYIDGVNIKMAKSGGIIEAAGIARQAVNDRIRVMLGCMVESSVGISQAVYLSSLADYFDLDGPLLLSSDVATGVDVDDEYITVSEDIIGGPKLMKEYISA